MKKFIVLAIISLFSIRTASCSDTVIVRDLRTGWLESDEEFNWSPVSKLERTTRVVVQLDSLEKEGLLRICAETPLALWVGSRLLPQQLQIGCNYLEMQELVPYFSGNTYLLTITSETGVDKLITEVVKLTKDQEKEVTATVSLRERNIFPDFYILSILILLGLLSLMKLLFPVKYSKLVRNPFSSNFGGSNIEDSYSDFFGLDNLYSILFFSLVLSLNLVYIDTKVSVLSQEHHSFSDLFITWLKSGGIIGILIMGKYTIANLFSSLFQWRGIPNIQIQDYIYVFTLLSIVGSLFTSLDFSFFQKGNIFLVESVWFLFLTMSIFFQFWLYFKIVRFYSHKKILIISYLCTTEFLPGFLVIAWLMKFI